MTSSGRFIEPLDDAAKVLFVGLEPATHEPRSPNAITWACAVASTKAALAAALSNATHVSLLLLAACRAQRCGTGGSSPVRGRLRIVML